MIDKKKKFRVKKLFVPIRQKEVWSAIFLFAFSLFLFLELFLFVGSVIFLGFGTNGRVHDFVGIFSGSINSNDISQDTRKGFQKNNLFGRVFFT